jgi:hypothetical protein
VHNSGICQGFDIDEFSLRSQEQATKPQNELSEDFKKDFVLSRDTIPLDIIKDSDKCSNPGSGIYDECLQKAAVEAHVTGIVVRI